jgi:predicted ATPase/DNA-binding winged helix-turn-helix (wHTH) protein
VITNLETIENIQPSPLSSRSDALACRAAFRGDRMMSYAAEAGLAFGRFCLFPRRRLLLRDGSPVELGGRAVEVLAALLEARGVLLSKDELMERVWPGVVVEENNLHVHISALRKVLGRDRGVIRTISGRGYCFTGEVRVQREPLRSGAVADRAPGPVGHRHPTNLPAPMSSFIGRADEMAELEAIVAQHRLVTVLGAAGIGKTRLGLETARRLLSDYPGGVWFADLGSLASEELVPATIATALGLEPANDDKALDRACAALEAKQLLLLVDNCEHVGSAAARAVESVLHAVPGLHVVTASREPLGVEGECCYRLAPLDTPDAAATAAETARSDAVRLFLERARAADPRFTPDDGAVYGIARICRRLDGLPLAIEFAATRLAALGISELDRRLDDRFRILTGGRRSAAARHQTLRASLDWSYRLFAAEEQAVLRRLAIFGGGFTLEGASIIIADDAVSAGDVVARLADLVDKSLIGIDAGAGVRRYRMLETTRAYALEKLAESGETGDVGRRHAVYCRAAERRPEARQTTPSTAWSIDHAVICCMRKGARDPKENFHMPRNPRG